MPSTTLLLITILAVLLFFSIFMYLLERKELNQLKQILKELQSKFQSTTVKHGKNWEHFVPFMKNFPGDKENSVFIGNPIDYISFGNDKITFIEVKTGTSKLNKKQKHIKQLIENKQVDWKEMDDFIS